MAGGGTEQGRMKHLIAHVDRLEDLLANERAGKIVVPPRNPPPPAKRGQKRGSFNHEFLLRVGMYADGQDGAARSLTEWLHAQQREGHCSIGDAIETNSGSHCQLNEAPAAAGLLVAVHRKDVLLLELFRDWWWSEMVLCQACLIPGAESRTYKKGEPTVWAPGWRGTIDGVWTGSNSCRDLCFRLIFGHPVPAPGKALWLDKYNLAARALALLPEAELKALRPAPGWIPPLPYAFHARRWPTVFQAWFDAPQGLKDVARQARFWDGVPEVHESSPGGWDVQAPEMIDFPGLRE